MVEGMFRGVAGVGEESWVDMNHDTLHICTKLSRNKNILNNMY